MSSPLVEAFTPAEREALSKFKAEYLQKALEEAAGESSTSDLEIWNISITKDDPRVDVIIIKFLRAKYILPFVLVTDISKLVLPETYSQFVKTLKWRREFDPRKATTEEHDRVYDNVGYVVGHDKKNRLITYNLYGGLDNEAVCLFDCQAHPRCSGTSINSSDGELE